MTRPVKGKAKRVRDNWADTSTGDSYRAYDRQKVYRRKRRTIQSNGVAIPKSAELLQAEQSFFVEGMSIHRERAAHFGTGHSLYHADRRLGLAAPASLELAAKTDSGSKPDPRDRHAREYWREMKRMQKIAKQARAVETDPLKLIAKRIKAAREELRNLS